MNIYIIRHGTTAWNLVHKIQGEADIPLDENGLQMAVETGEEFKKIGLKFDKVFSSPLVRAYITAKEVSNGVEITTDDRLKEINFGGYEGKLVDELYKSETNGGFRNFREKPEAYEPIDGGETLRDVANRAGEFIHEVIEPLYTELPNGNILIACHGALLRGLMMYILGESDISNFWGKGLSQNCGVSLIKYDGESYVIEYESKTFYNSELSKKVKSLL